MAAAGHPIHSYRAFRLVSQPLKRGHWFTVHAARGDPRRAHRYVSAERNPTAGNTRHASTWGLAVLMIIGLVPERGCCFRLGRDRGDDAGQRRDDDLGAA